MTAQFTTQVEELPTVKRTPVGGLVSKLILSPANGTWNRATAESISSAQAAKCGGCNSLSICGNNPGEVIRGQGGYVFAKPSMIPVNRFNPALCKILRDNQ